LITTNNYEENIVNASDKNMSKLNYNFMLGEGGEYGIDIRISTPPPSSLKVKLAENFLCKQMKTFDIIDSH